MLSLPVPLTAVQILAVAPSVDPDFPANELRKLNGVLYNQLIQATIRILQKLDLSCTRRSGDGSPAALLLTCISCR